MRLNIHRNVAFKSERRGADLAHLSKGSLSAQKCCSALLVFGNPKQPSLFIVVKDESRSAYSPRSWWLASASSISQPCDEGVMVVLPFRLALPFEPAFMFGTGVEGSAKATCQSERPGTADDRWGRFQASASSPDRRVSLVTPDELDHVACQGPGRRLGARLKPTSIYLDNKPDTQLERPRSGGADSAHFPERS